MTSLLFGLGLLVVLGILWTGYVRRAKVSRMRNQSGSSEGKVNIDRPEVFEAENIVPLEDFDWRSVEPAKVRPFKAKYHLTMGLQNLTPSKFLNIDSTYLDRLALRSKILAAHPTITLQASPAAIPAINELYTWLITVYLPHRFPTIFKLTSTTLLNTALSPPHPLPLTPPSDPIQALKILGENIDQDFLFMIRDEDEEKEGGYRLQGYIVCFPSGFNTKEKLGMRLREIHAPVPGYKEKLERSMDRFFERVEVGRVVGRYNWAISTTSELFTPSGTHLYDGQDPKAEDDFEINDVHLRTESQTLHRLPRTKALLFTFHTSLYPLSDICAEGSGPELADAIDGLKTGSVPEMDFYKRGVVWGERVKAYLREEVNMNN